MTDGGWLSLGVSAVVMIGGPLAAFITGRLRKSKGNPEFIDTAFAAYDKIMQRQDVQLKLKDEEILRLTARVGELERENVNLRERS